MKNPLKKLAGSKHTDRREALEQDAAEKIKQVGSQAPSEVTAATWAHPAPEAPLPHTMPSTTDEHAPTARRLTVQERMAARSGS